MNDQIAPEELRQLVKEWLDSELERDNAWKMLKARLPGAKAGDTVRYTITRETQLFWRSHNRRVEDAKQAILEFLRRAP